MIGQPITVTMRRLHLEPGAALPQTGQVPTMWLVDEGGVTASALPSEPGGKEMMMEFPAGSSFSDRTFPGTDSLTVTNTGSEPATLLETVIELAGRQSSVGDARTDATREGRPAGAWVVARAWPGFPDTGDWVSRLAASCGPPCTRSIYWSP